MLNNMNKLDDKNLTKVSGGGDCKDLGKGTVTCPNCNKFKMHGQLKERNMKFFYCPACNMEFEIIQIDSDSELHLMDQTDGFQWLSDYTVD